MRKLWTLLVAMLTLALVGCGYNTFQVNDEQVKSSRSEVVNQYQRRADLIPNLVNTVKGYAAQEKEITKAPGVEFGSPLGKAPTEPEGTAK